LVEQKVDIQPRLQSSFRYLFTCVHYELEHQLIQTMTSLFKTLKPSFSIIIILLFIALSVQSKYASQYVNVDCSSENPSLSMIEKEHIWYNYVKLSEGNWIHYSFSDSTGNNQSVINRSSKDLCKELSRYLVDQGVEPVRIIMKYSPYASLVVYKESGKNIHANYVSRASKNAQLFTINNQTGGSCLTKAGNKIDFPSEAFNCAKDALVDVEIHEMLSKGDFVKTGYTSTSNGKILESRGMYHIKATHEGIDVKLRRGKSAEIKFAKNNFPTIDEASMFNTFYGQEKKGIVNWKISGFEKTTSNTSSNSGDLPPISKRQKGSTRLTRKVTYTETTYVQLCKKIHLVNTTISKNMKSCKLDKQTYSKLIKEHGKLNHLLKGNLVDISSFKEYLSIAKKNPNSVLLGLNQKQKEDYDQSAAEERKERIAAAEERRKRFLEQQRKIDEERAKQQAISAARVAAELKNFPVTMRISKLGNINCDRFDNNVRKTNVIVQLDDFDYDQIKVYAIFKNIKSVIHGYYRKEHKGMIKFDNLPRGKKVTYLAATFKGDEVKLAYFTKRIKEDDHIKLSLTTYTRDNYERVLDDLIP
jgi:hypothetical protein